MCTEWLLSVHGIVELIPGEYLFLEFERHLEHDYFLQLCALQAFAKHWKRDFSQGCNGGITNHILTPMTCECGNHFRSSKLHNAGCTGIAVVQKAVFEVTRRLHIYLFSHWKLPRVVLVKNSSFRIQCMGLIHFTQL